MTIIITLVDLFISLFVLVLSLFVLYEDPGKKVNRIFGITIFFFASWIVCSSLSDITGFWGSEFWALWFARASVIGPFIFCPLFVYFTYYFPREESNLSTGKIIGLFLPSLAGIAFFATDYNVASITLESWGTGFEPGLLYVWLLICLLSYFGYGFYRLIRNYRTVKIYHEKAQIFYVSIGAALFVLLGILANIVLPLYGISQYSVFAPAVAVLIFSSLTAYAIVAHHMMDIWLVMRMGTIFSLVFAIISFIYIGIMTLLTQYSGLSYVYSLILVSLIVTLTFEPLKKFIEKKSDRIFFHKHYNFDEVIEELTSAIHGISLDLNKILTVSNEIVRRNFKVRQATIAVLTPKDAFLLSAAGSAGEAIELPPDNPLVAFLNENRDFIVNREDILHGLDRGEIRMEVDRIDLVPRAYEEMVKLDFTLAIPISSGDKLIAIYFIGEKLSKDFFTYQDLRLLSHLTGEVGVMINNARLYEDLKKLDEAKSNFISVVSHQLRTPLSAIRWSTELLLDGSVDKDSEQEFLRDNYKNSLFIIYQLDDMLTALDLEDRRIDIKSEKCSLRPLIEEIAKENEVIIRAKKMEIIYSFPPKAESIFCDCKKIRKVIEILMRNAIRYTPDSGGRAEIVMREKIQGDEKLLEISVADNGIGISPKEEGYIFEKFFRGEEAKKISPNGFGLGLFIVRAFARAHGGEAHFESAGRNKGSRFYLTVRLNEAEAARIK